MIEECPTCGHAAEGFAVSVSWNARLLRKGKPLERPSCSTGFDTGMTGVDECGCQDDAHSKVLVSTHRILR